MLNSLMAATFLFSIVFGTIGIIRFLKSMPMLNTEKVQGFLMDARRSDISIHSIENLPSAVDYLYYTYTYKGIKHGGNIISLVPTAASRNMFNQLLEAYKNQEEPTPIDVYVNLNDSRKSFLLSPQEVSNFHGILGMMGLAATGILYLINKGI